MKPFQADRSLAPIQTALELGHIGLHWRSVGYAIEKGSHIVSCMAIRTGAEHIVRLLDIHGHQSTGVGPSQFINKMFT